MPGQRPGAPSRGPERGKDPLMRGQRQLPLQGAQQLEGESDPGRPVFLVAELVQDQHSLGTGGLAC